jgi:hypothetical protein
VELLVVARSSAEADRAGQDAVGLA